MNPETQTSETLSYTLSLAGEGITLERKVTKDVALKLINVALGDATGPRGAGRTGAEEGGQTAHSQATEGEGGTRGVSEERVTAGEFIETVNAHTNPEKIVAFGVFIRDNRGQDNFTREDIKGMFRSAHETPPANFGRDFRAALSENWIASEHGSSDPYFVTKKGTKAMQNQFAEGRTRKPRRKASQKSSGSDDD